MKQKALVREVSGNCATIEVTRSAMCDGCVKRDCESHTCAAGALLGSAKTMTARAKNPVGATVGDTVWVESADKTVLGYAALVFLMPVVVCLCAWGIAERLGAPLWGSAVAAGGGFVLSFIVIALVEKRKKMGEPDIVITGVLPSETE